MDDPLLITQKRLPICVVTSVLHTTPHAACEAWKMRRKILWTQCVLTLKQRAQIADQIAFGEIS